MNSESVLPIVLELLVKSALIAAAAATLARGWRGATSAQRHLVWLVALAAILLLPCTRLAAPRWAIALQPAKRVSVTLPVAALAPSTGLLEMVPLAKVSPAPARVRVPIDWRKVVLALWLGGAAAVLGYRLFGSWRVRCLHRRSVPVEDGRVRLLMARTAAELGLRRRVEVRLSDECRVPITWGTWRPVMLLPREALAWSDTWLTAALRHEAAHILRRDDLTRWIAWIACALYWPNPVIWIAARSLRVAQEQAADDLVLSSGTPAEEYATQLVDAARLVATRGFFARHAVAMACPSTLEDRIVAIVDGRRDRRPLGRFAAAIGSTAILLTLALCTAAQLQGADEKPATPTEPKAARPFGPEIEIEAKFVEIPVKDGTASDLNKLTIFSDPQFQVIYRALNQRKGVTIAASPRVTTRINLRAMIEIIKELRYPTAWEKQDGKWMPTQYETKNVGTTMDVEPRLKEDGSLELRTTVSQVQFLGFVDTDDAKTYPAPRNALGDEKGAMPQVPLGHRYSTVFSERKKEETIQLKSAETAMIPSLPESADVKPFEQTAPHDQLAVFISPRLLVAAAPARALPTADETKEAAAQIVIPKLEFRDATLQEAVATLQQKVTEASGDKPAISIVAAPSVEANPAKITVSLTQIPLAEAVKYLAGLANQTLDFRPGAIVIGTLPPDAFAAGFPPPLPGPQLDGPVRKKAIEIVIPKFEIRDATLAEAIDALTKQAVAFDPEKKGIKIQFVPGPVPAGGINPEEARITIDLTNIPLIEAIKYVAGLAGLDEIYTPTAVELRPAKPAAPAPPEEAAVRNLLPPPGAATTGLITKEWKVEPDLIPPKPGGDGKERISAKDWLVSRGLVFEGAATAVFIPATNRLLVRNTPEQIALVDQIIAATLNLTGSGTINLSGGTLNIAGVSGSEKTGTGTLDLKGTLAAPGNAVKPTDKPIDIQADSTRMENGIAIAEGHVRVTWGRYSMTADTVRYDPNTKTAHLLGKVEVANDINVIQAEDVEITLEGDGQVRVKGPHKTIIRSATPPSAAEKQVNDLTLKSFAAMLEGQQLQAAGKSSEAQTKLREAKEALAQIKMADAELQLRLDQLRQRLAEMEAAPPATSKAPPATSDTAKPALQGRVLAVNAAWHFAVLSMGEKQGVMPRTVFKVMRGNETIARLRVTNVEPATSIANILPESVRAGVNVQPGDTVILEGLEIAPPAPGTPSPELAAPQPGNPIGFVPQHGPEDAFVSAYLHVQKGERLKAQSDIQGALQEMEAAARLLDELSKSAPQWQPEIMTYRKKRTADAIESLRKTLNP
ncbi:MAG TPA: M56 family metallopeptidase [Chthoniobacter sp.]|nr:M56 family metallopeptidase [Chthoniobacter sp.]